MDYDAEESPVADEEERPYSQEELRKRIMKGVSASPDGLFVSDQAVC